MADRYPRIASFKSVAALREHARALHLDLPCDDAILPASRSPLGEPLSGGGLTRNGPPIPNRFVIQPMEGWDATEAGRPTELTTRRWRNFGRSGAGLIWGGEAVAVREDGRANPNQLLINDATAADLGALRKTLVDTARTDDHPLPIVGLQLTHSGRWARTVHAHDDTKPAAARGISAPRIAYRHPLLDRRVGVEDDAPVLDDTEIDALVRSFATAARLAQEEGFDFIDLKHCHGYLLHEFLSARRRPGAYGGPTLADRSRLTMELIGAIRTAAPRIGIGVRLSAFDRVPHRPSGTDAEGHLGPGVAEDVALPYDDAFGLLVSDPTRSDFAEPIAWVRTLVEQGITWFNVTAGSPYYVPHIQRPALFPPSDGYAPPEDPLVGVARLLDASRVIKRAVPTATVVSSGWSYLQEYLPHVAQACVRNGWCDAVGLGRMVLSYPDLPADVLGGRPLARKRICRTFSDCTTAPRKGLISGCYPLDPFYRDLPERLRLEALKRPT